MPSSQPADGTSGKPQPVSSYSEQPFPITLPNSQTTDFAQPTDPVQTEHQRLVTPLRALGFAVFTGSTAALTYLAVAGVPVAFAFGGAVGFGVLSITLLIAIAATKMPDSNKHPSKPVAFLGEFALGFYAIPALVVVIGEGMVTEYQERRAKEQAPRGEKAKTPRIHERRALEEVLLGVDSETVTSNPIDQTQQKGRAKKQAPRGIKTDTRKVDERRKALKLTSIHWSSETVQTKARILAERWEMLKNTAGLLNPRHLTDIESLQEKLRQYGHMPSEENATGLNVHKHFLNVLVTTTTGMTNRESTGQFETLHKIAHETRAFIAILQPLSPQM